MRRWYWQRVSALILFGGLLALVALALASGGLSGWQTALRSLPARLLVVATAIAWLVHAWTGLLDVSADYLRHPFWRRAFLLFWAVWLTTSLVWLLQVIGW